MKMRYLPLASLLPLLFAGSVGAASPEVEALLKPCAECHGSDGIAVKPAVPHLNGQLSGYLSESMAKIQSGKRPTAVPGHLPAAIGAAQREEIAQYFAGIKPARPAQTGVDAAKAAQGEAIYQKRCADCHPDNGRESDKDAPLMAGQNLEFLIAESELFTKGKRKFAFLQDEAYQGLGAAELESVAHFFASQDPVPQPKTKKKRR